MWQLLRIVLGPMPHTIYRTAMGGGRPEGMRMGGRGPMGGGQPNPQAALLAPGGLLQVPSVQQELGLNELQVEECRSIVEEVRGRFRAEVQALQQLGGGPETQTKGQALRHKVNAELHTALADLLTPEQLTRLTQLELQVQGPMAFSDPRARAALNLNDEEVARLEARAQEVRKEMQHAIRDGAVAGAGDPRSRLTAMRRQALEKVAEALTPEQREAWKALLGKPFEVKLEGPPRGASGPRGPGGPAASSPGPFSLDFDEL
jgi:hypothetical protein